MRFAPAVNASIRTKNSGRRARPSSGASRSRRSPVPKSSAAGLSCVKSHSAISTRPKSTPAPGRNSLARQRHSGPPAKSGVARSPTSAPSAAPARLQSTSRFVATRAGR